MKNQIIFIFLILGSLTNSFCKKSESNQNPQNTIPNSDFETWIEDDSFEKPQDWNTSNFSLYGVVTFNTVEKITDNLQSGDFCSKLTTQSQLINNNEVKVAGLITLGNFDVNLASRRARISGGIPFISKPIGLDGYYKYTAANIDSCFVDITLTKFNTQRSVQDTIAHARFSSSSVSNWTHFDLPIKYFSNETPDSMNIVILSSDTSIFEAGSTLWIDNLSLKY